MSTALAARPSSGNLYDVIDLILDKGLVIDVFARVSLVGIELLTVDVRVVVASVDTYLHFAEAANRLDLASGQRRGQGGGLAGLVGGGLPGAAGGLPTSQVQDAIQGGVDRLQETSAMGESAAQSAQEKAGDATGQ